MTTISTGGRIAADSPYYSDVDSLLRESDAVALVEVTESRSAVIETSRMTVYTADVLKSIQAGIPSRIELAAIPDNGTAETIDLAVGKRYVVFLTTHDDRPAGLVSPTQGVFPVDGDVAGASREGSFGLGALASQLGLK
ncbi:hypothetical protein [Propionicicella superfundia]|uniref:hypothetical protein n=1 Tax=Propionicicella superfundia TaxID=348582 RepID=UPI0012EB28DC|nr:hypothetical protein [Propionicicella superfundia]